MLNLEGRIIIPVVVEAFVTVSLFKHIKVCLRPSLQS